MVPVRTGLRDVNLNPSPESTLGWQCSPGEASQPSALPLVAQREGVASPNCLLFRSCGRLQSMGQCHRWCSRNARTAGAHLPALAQSVPAEGHNQKRKPGWGPCCWAECIWEESGFLVIRSSVKIKHARHHRLGKMLGEGKGIWTRHYFNFQGCMLKLKEK